MERECICDILPLFNDEGEVDVLVATLTDFTAHKQLEEAVLQPALQLV